MPYKDKEKERKFLREYRSRPEEKARSKEYMKEYYQNNKIHLINYGKKYNKENKEKISTKMKEYSQKLESKFKRNKRQKYRWKKDFNYNLSKRLRVFIWSALKSYSITGKIKPSCEYGIDYKAIIEHLKPFPKEIKNYHVDHIIPLSMWDFNNPQHIKKAFSPENHQWLTANQNLWKHDKLVAPSFIGVIK